MNYLENLFKYENNCEIVGLTNQLNAFCVINYFNNNDKNVIVLTNSLYEANKYFDLLTTLTDNVYLFPMDDFLSSVALAISPDLKIKRLETLKNIQSNKKSIIVCNLMGFLRYLPDVKIFNDSSFILKKDLTINRESLIEKLETFGYNRNTLVSNTGEYAIRGYIIDIFPIEFDHPIRIEFFGNDLESIRKFDENTQLSIEKVDEVEILPYEEIKTDNNSSLYDYLNNPTVFMVEKSQVYSGYKKISEDILNYNVENNIDTKYMFNFEEINIENIIYLDSFLENAFKAYNYETKEIENFNSNFELLESFVYKYINLGKTIIFYLSSESEIKNIKEIFSSCYVTSEDNIYKNKVNIINKKLDNGFIIDNYVVISEYDIENVKNKQIKYKNTYKIGRKLRKYDELEVGDYVVHYSHGIGVYKGVITLSKNGIKKDYLLISYAEGDKIYIPVEKIDTIFKYSSKDSIPPKIARLNNTSWEKTRRSLQKKIHDISEQLLILYAKRAQVKGVAFKSDPLEDMFDADFRYVPTADQQNAFDDIKKDLEKVTPMDRLLCGDVGFGKTEVAFRAMFKTVINNYQVAYLCPTTILSKQQYENALERFKNFPVQIALLNRFTTPKETRNIIEGLKNGTIDIVFGTHRLLSKDIGYKNLGLLVVDEEQRFGVTHKERIKEYKNDVNVLTLTATPIPRTLKMATSGLRDLSIIDTAPINRYPVQTYVIQDQEVIIKDAIYKEMSRNGQVFILYNRVDLIESKKDEIQRLVPEARIVIAHGRMNKSEMENVMADFIDYKYDILLCTTIIETGIDIPNANTLIIYNADNFGLAQLYQIRGRVGRSNKIAYAYLTYDKNKMLNDDAIKRLQAIKEFTELGSGYKIAMRDLSIRGAGDILGSEQSGSISEVGIDLYMKLVDDEMKKLKGEDVESNDTSNKSLIDVETHISDSYVDDEALKIEIHHKINEIDSYEKLVEIQKELEDRFGKVSEELHIYMYEEWFEKLAEKLHITKVIQDSSKVEIELKNEIISSLKFDKIFLEAYNINSKFRFRSANNCVYITLPINNLEKHFVYYLVDLLNYIYQEIKKLNG